MPQTVREIIERSLRLIGVLADGESATASEIADGLVALRGIIDDWSLSDMMIPTHTIETFSLLTTQRTYTYGTGGDFNAARPMEIVTAWFNDGGTRDIEVKRADARHHARVSVKEHVGRPAFYWADPGETLWTIRFDCLPVDPSITFVTRKELDATQELSEVTAFPKGFDRALAFNLAEDIAPEFGREASATVMRTARMAKAAIKRKYHRPVTLSLDPAYGGRRPPYAIESGPV